VKCTNGAYSGWSVIKSFTTLSGCTDSRSITQSVNSGQTDNQQASNTITATNQINNGATANYDAGTTVFLKPGFRAKSGSNFRAFIQGCSANRSLAAKNREEIITATTPEDLEAPKELTQNKEFGIKIYPNPTNDVFKISSKESIVQYTISNQFNRTISKKSINADTFEVDIRNLRKGIYFVKLELNTGEIMTKKIIKN
jgi:hypothetical protein